MQILFEGHTFCVEHSFISLQVFVPLIEIKYQKLRFAFIFFYRVTFSYTYPRGQLHVNPFSELMQVAIKGHLFILQLSFSLIFP